MLYIVSTPIGNLEDLTARAKKVLGKVDYILCEDTRVTGLMLKSLGVDLKAKMISYYDEVEEQKLPEVIKFLEEGLSLALVTDSGTPIISDPGYKLVKKCREQNIPVAALPGPCAAINAMVLSGLPGGRFSFLGFLPKKEGERKRVLEEYKNVGGSKIVYESPYRIGRLISEIRNVYGDEIKVAMCREMTKLHEEVIWGNIAQIEEVLKKRKLKGEMVVVFS